MVKWTIHGLIQYKNLKFITHLYNNTVFSPFLTMLSMASFSMFLKLKNVWQRVKGTIHGLIQYKNWTFTTHRYNNTAFSPIVTMICKSLPPSCRQNLELCGKWLKENTWTDPIWNFDIYYTTIQHSIFSYSHNDLQKPSSIMSPKLGIVW